jgi:hypothetical protein
VVADVAARRADIAAAGTQVAFVHMHPESQAAEFFARYGVADLPRVSDPGQRLYTAFALGSARMRDWLSPRVLVRYLRTLRAGHGAAMMGGDVRRLPGAFLVADGAIVKAFRPDSVADDLDLSDLAVCPPPAGAGGGAATPGPEA